MSEYASDYVASLSDDYIEWKSAEERTKKDIFGIIGRFACEIRCHVPAGVSS